MQQITKIWYKDYYDGWVEIKRSYFTTYFDIDWYIEWCRRFKLPFYLEHENVD